MTSMYSASCFSALPSLGEARVAFATNEGSKFLDGPIRTLFLDANVQGRYGVALLHRHFLIQPTQRLVDYHHTATAWTANNVTSDIFPKYDGLVVPRTYLFDEGGDLRPYEFEFLSNKDDSPSTTSGEDIDFFKVFYTLLRQNNLDKLFGIRDLHGFDPALSVEVTEGTANIMLSPTAITTSNLIEAMWTFSSDNQKCHCREYCFPVGNQHEANHGCS